MIFSIFLFFFSYYFRCFLLYVHLCAPHGMPEIARAYYSHKIQINRWLIRLNMCNVHLDYTKKNILIKKTHIFFHMEIFSELVAELKSQIPDVENIFKIHRRIGEGTFSTVFLTSLRAHEHLPNKRLFALKYLIPTSHPRRIAQELRCLREIG